MYYYYYGVTISHISLKDLWGEYNIEWSPDVYVNILDGLNGIGKSTLLKLIAATLSPQKYGYLLSESLLNGTKIVITLSNGLDVSLNTPDKLENICVEWISTFDTLLPNGSRKKRNKTLLDWQLECLLYQRDSNIYSFTDYRLSATNPKEDANLIRQDIEELFLTINDFFKLSSKTIFISADNKVLFQKGDRILEHSDLSSGEKQLLIILFTVFLQRKKYCILLLDNPENSLHTRWQRQLIEALKKLNKSLQIITSTHSPSIYGDGWMDKIVRMREIVSSK